MCVRSPSKELHTAAFVGMSKPVLIIGAGFAGLSLARTLLAQRIPFRIFDSSPQLRKHSYGVTLLSWAYNPLASMLNLGSETDLRRSTATDCAVGGLGVITSARNKEQPDSYRCNRSKLSTLLAQGLDVEFNSKLESIHSSSTGVLVRFEGGETAEGILAVGADGVHSAGQYAPSVWIGILQSTTRSLIAVPVTCSAWKRVARNNSCSYSSPGHQWQFQPGNM